MLAGSACWLLLATGGCGSAGHGNFFESGLSAGSSNAGTTSAAGSSGVALSSGGLGSGGLGGGESVAGNANAGSGGSGAGCAFSCGDGGRAGGTNLAGDGGSEVGGDSGQAGSGSEPTVCSPFAPDATYLPSTQHCYLVDTELRTFADAQTHCAELKAHLVTLGSEAEHDFAWSIHSEEHWIGARDGKAPKQSGVGSYSWVTDEPFDYSNWSREQPNASKTECVDGGACYEHCAFQWKGGEHDGLWNDRYCMHTVASICEWDSTP